MNPTIQYKINTIKHTVTAVATDCTYDAIKKINTSLMAAGIHDLYASYYDEQDKEYRMPATIAATIKYDDDNDPAELERHKYNARNSLMDKYHRMRLKRIENFFANYGAKMFNASVLAAKVDNEVLSRYPFQYIEKAEYKEIEKRREIAFANKKAAYLKCSDGSEEK